MSVTSLIVNLELKGLLKLALSIQIGFLASLCDEWIQNVNEIGFSEVSK